MAKRTPKKVNKSAEDGRFVSDEEVKKKPKTTYRQTVQPPKPPKNKTPKKD